ncbi:histidine kinase, partial [Vibrio parahaemolyticus]|nr:histidine kinase [Vibrio parahaemolyticus]
MGTSVTPNIFDFLIKIDPFDKLPEPVVESIANSVKVKYLVRGETIGFSALCDQRYLYIIRTGAIEQRTPNGELRARLGQDDQFGFTFLDPLENAEDGYQAEAIEDSLLYLIPHFELKLVSEEHPEFADYFAAQANVRLSSAVKYVCRKEEKGLFF